MKLRRGRNPHRRGLDNSVKAMTWTQNPCFPEVTATPAMLVGHGRGKRETAVVVAAVRHGAPIKPPRAAGHHEQFRGSGASPRSGFPLERVENMDAHALGHIGRYTRSRHYWSSDSTRLGSEFAIWSVLCVLCTSIWARVRLDTSSAMSASRITDSEAMTFSKVTP